MTVRSAVRHALRTGAGRSGVLPRLQLEAAYRLVLGRAPDAGGMAHFRDRLVAGAIDLDGVVAEMVGSQEFRRAHPGLLADDPATTVVDSGEFRIHVHAADHAVGYAMTVDRDYEPEVAAALRSLLRPGDTFVDVGANYGWHSLLAASLVGDSGRVLAIEPNPANAELLARSAHDNGFSTISVVVAAVAEQPGWAALVTDGSNGWIAPLGDAAPAALPCSFAVPLRRLDDLVSDAGLAAVDVIKVDVEGNEPTVLDSGPGVLGGALGGRRPVVVTEFFPRLLADNGRSSAAGYLAALRSRAFDLSVVGHPEARSDEEIMRAVEGHDHIDLVCRPT